MLRRLPEAQITWPNEADFQLYSDLISSKHPLLVGAFGFVDGLNLPVQTAANPTVENFTYNGWTCEHYISNIFAFAPNGRIIFAVLNAPGSYHDAKIAQPLYDKLLNRTPEGSFILSDTAFPRLAPWMKNKIRAPIKDGDRLPDDPMERLQMKRMSEHVTSARQAAEWGMRSLQGSFGRLKVPLPINDHRWRRNILEVCSMLHNVRTVRVGINQIRTVYEAVWLEGGKDEYEEFAELCFGRLVDNDRIRQFYMDTII